jgi:hypothetical protein
MPASSRAVTSKGAKVMAVDMERFPNNRQAVVLFRFNSAISSSVRPS